jgi:hypothetical protein
MLGTPRIFVDFPTIALLASENERIDLRDDYLSQINPKPGIGMFFVATPENQADLESIAKQYPGGEWRVVPRKTEDETLYFAYTIPPSQ